MDANNNRRGNTAAKLLTKGDSMRLTNDDLMRVAPTIFTSSRNEARTSEKYAFIPTIRVVDALRSAGWFPVKAVETRTRIAGNSGFQKHMINFRKDGQVMALNGLFPEIVLTNSHDGLSSFQLHAGLFRLVCANGLVIADTTFMRQSVRHVGYTDLSVLEASYEVVKELPAIVDKVENFSSIELQPVEKVALANAALKLRYEDAEIAPIRGAQLLQARRSDDQKSDLFSVYNTIQENLIKGGLRGIRKERDEETGAIKNVSITTTRGIKGISENIKLNKALWTLTEEMTRIKQAA